MEHQQADSFVTGATGFIGRWLVATLTSSGHRVAALVRDAARRGPELAAFVDRIGGDSSKLIAIEGDLRADDLGLDTAAAAGLGEVRDVYHLAARMELGLSAAAAREINAGGTERLVRWAAARPRLRRLVYLGGYRIEAMPAWLAEASYPLPEPIRRRLYRSYGAYEASKLEAHVAVRRLAAELAIPTTTINPSGVIGDSRTGATTQIEGLGETVARLWRGKLPALVGTSRTWVPLVAVDHLAAMIASVAGEPTAEGVEMTVLDPTTPALPELVGDIADHLGVSAPRRLLPVSLVKALPQAITGLHRGALGFLSEDRYDTASADAHARDVGIEAPPLDRTLGRWVDELVSTRFLEAPDAPRGGFHDAGGTRIFALGDAAGAGRVMLHGLPWTANSWEPLLAEIGDAASTLRPDLPGLGRSAPLPGAESSDWLDELLSGARDRVELFGHSLGTATAVEYAAAHPERIARLVLVAPFFLQKRAGWLFRRRSLVAAALRRSSADKLRRQLLDGAPGADDALASASAELSRPGVARRVAGALAQGPEVRRRLGRSLESMAAAGVPVILIAGSEDPLVTAPPDGVEVITIEGAGHNPHVTHASEVAASLRGGVAGARRSGQLGVDGIPSVRAEIARAALAVGVRAVK